jgi:hypothetical protein
MTTITPTISQSNADGHELSTTSVSATSTGVYLYSTFLYGAFVFTIPDIASGDTINSATFTAYVLNTTYDDIDHTIYAQDADSAAWVSETNGDISGRTLTTASKAYSASSVGRGDYAFTGLADVIQEVIDRGGWNAGNRLCLIITNGGSANLRLESYDNGGGHPAQLSIDYTAGSGGAAKMRKLRQGTRFGAQAGT